MKLKYENNFFRNKANLKDQKEQNKSNLFYFQPKDINISKYSKINQFLNVQKTNNNNLSTIDTKINRPVSSNIIKNNYYTTLNRNNEKTLSRVSSISNYLDRRHEETKDHINKLKQEKQEKEVNGKFRPYISNNSKRIIDNLIKREKEIKENNKKSKQAKPINTPILIKDNSNNLKHNIEAVSNYKITKEELEKNSKLNNLVKHNQFDHQSVIIIY